MELSRIPKIGEKFHFFDEGKTSPSRHFIVEILQVLSIDEVSDTLLAKITEEQKECTWILAPETDYILIGKLLDTDIEPLYFIRDIDGGWFSIDFWAGELDIDGSRYKKIIDDQYKYFKDEEHWNSIDEAKNWYNDRSNITKETLEGAVEYE